MHLQHPLALILVAAILCTAGCGGSSGTPAAPVVKAPTVTLSPSALKLAVGAPLTLSWSSSDSTSCQVSEGLSPSLAVTGSTVIQHAAGGIYNYTVTCSGPGGVATSTARIVVPMTVLPTSYENKNSIPFDATAVPTVRALGIAKTLADEQDSVDRSVAFGDFFQEGRYSAFVMVGRFANLYGTGWSDVPGVGYFLGQDASGQWVDRSAELFKSTADRMGCISPSFTAVADFNNDRRPDIYIACTGLDFAIPGATPEQNQAAGRSFQVVYLSQADGSYRSQRVEEANPLYGHKAVALDINGDGNTDIVTSDFIDPAQPNGCGAPYVLLGRGDGSFQRDYSYIDRDAVRTLMPMCGFFDVDVVPVDGRLDLMIGGLTRVGLDQGSWGVLWIKGRPGGFDHASALIMPMPLDPASQSQYQFPLDILYDAASAGFYMKTTASGGYGTQWAILRFDRSGVLAGIIDQWLNTGVGQSPQFKPSSAMPGYLEAYSGGCAADLSRGDCGRRIRM